MTTSAPSHSTTVIEDVRAAFNAGLATLPARKDGSKVPALDTWREYQERRPTTEELGQWFRDVKQYGYLIVCGPVSAPDGLALEVLDFDDLDAFKKFVELARGSGFGEVVERIKSGLLVATPAAGRHVYYFCEDIGGNTKLAQRPKDNPEPGGNKYDPLIETRGLGGMVVGPGSAGRTHPTGRGYKTLAGDFSTIPTVTPEERATLLDLARALDETEKQEYVPKNYTPATSGALRPGDDFNERGPTWSEMLQPLGWTLAYTQGNKQCWRRPGKQQGISATVNGPGVGPDRLYVFSSSTELEPQRSYTRYQAYTCLHLHGDFQASARELARQGYGEQQAPPAARELPSAPVEPSEDGKQPAVTLEDFRAYMPEHKFIFMPSGELWPAASVNARIDPIPTGTQKDNGNPTYEAAAAWLDRNRPVEQMTWAPGEDKLIENRLMADGSWFARTGCTCFNLYRPPVTEPGDPDMAGPWLEHVRRVYPDDADHIIRWLAHRVQRPGEKLNHALVLGGHQGIGKDTLLVPAKYAVGAWNFSEVTPIHLLGRFNSYVKSVILRISEARDLGDVDRYSFYEHMKVYTAAPPDVLRCDEKNIREYAVMNVCGVIITSNHKTDGIYLPADDRRHYIAWSELTMEDFTQDYWTRLYSWYASDGARHVASYLATLDISGFDAKAPPPKTPAFWDIVDSNRAPEDAELADALDSLAHPDAVTLSALADIAEVSFGVWLRDRKNSRQIPHRMEAAGYVTVRNDAQKDGRWKVRGKNVAVYAKRELSVRDRIAAARSLAEGSR